MLEKVMLSKKPDELDQFGKDRRRVLQNGLVVIVGLLGGFNPEFADAQNTTKSTRIQDVRYDISYMWHRDLESVLNYMEEVGIVLGSEVRKNLRAVKGKINFGLIYDLNSDLESAKKVATAHTKILRSEDLDGAIPVKDLGYYDLYNISYGVGPNLETQKRNFDKVWRVLPEVRKNLVIEETQDGNYALVYKRFGDKEPTFKLSQEHARKLKNEGLSASIILEQGNEWVYGEASRLDEEIGPRSPRRPRGDVPPEKSAQDKSLDKSVNNFIKSLRRRGRITNDETTAWSVFDFLSGEKLIALNEDKPMQTASMVKPLGALAFFHEVENGRLAYDSTSRAKLRASIQRSSNSATNWLIDIIGGPQRVHQILRQNYGHIFNNTNIVEKISPGGRTYRNTASAHDYSRFLYALWNNQLPYSSELRRLMALPKRSRLKGSRIPSGTLMYDKTGSTARLCGDMGVLVVRDRSGNLYPYTVIGIIQKGSRAKKYGTWIASRGDVIREVSNRVYDFMKARYRLA